MLKRKVLVCDDDEDIMDIMTMTALKLGFDVDFAVNGEEALRKIRDEKFHIVITDLKMPKANGIQVANQLRKTNPEAYTILITGYDVENLDEYMKKTGIKKKLLKPFDPVQFEETILDAFDSI